MRYSFFSQTIFSWLVVPLLTLVPGEGGAAVQTETATFAGGCFWCMEAPFDKLEGVISVTAGYTGGELKNPGYEQVSAGGTGHAEAVQITYDPSRISYAKLLEVFWHNIDPTVKNRQFCDVGSQYRSAIFVQNDDSGAWRSSQRKRWKRQSPSKSRF